MSTGPYGVSYSSIVCIVCSCNSSLMFLTIFCFKCCSVMVICNWLLDHGSGVYWCTMCSMFMVMVSFLCLDIIWLFSISIIAFGRW